MNKYQLIYTQDSIDNFTYDGTNKKFPLNPIISTDGDRIVRQVVFINGQPSALELVEGEAGKISDGYHTFDELYEHRIANFIALCKCLCFDKNQIEDDESNVVWKSKRHSDGELAFGGTWFVLGINKDAGRQITYHLPIEKWELCSFAPELETAPEWDGHSSADVLERLKAL